MNGLVVLFSGGIADLGLQGGPLNVPHLCRTSTSQYPSAQNTKELQPLMANPVCETTAQKKQQPQGPERPNSRQRFKEKLMQWVSYIAGDMAVFGEWMKGQFILLQILDWVLRGAAQVMFVNNPLSGLIIFAGLILQNRWWALNGFVGTLFATVSALILGQNRGAIANGLYGYNGILVGLLMAVFSNAGDWYWWLLLPNIFMSMACPIVSSALASINSRWDLPVFTLPFNILVCLHMVATGHYNHHFPQVLFQPRKSMHNLTWSELEYSKLFCSIPVGIGQVYGCDNPWTGGIFMVALFISSPITFAHATIGSAVGMVSAFFCAYLGSAIANVMSTFGLPACTWPFCLSALTFLLITTEIKNIHKLPLAKVTYPEKNLIYFWKMKKVERIDKQRKNQEKDVESQQKKEEIMAAMETKEHKRLDVCSVDVPQEETTQNGQDRNPEAIELNLTQL
ncbi:Urea transporter 2 [Labeo rohita]|uniref:Urea transporter 2 n=1 Tax=Labeo rohita TaxID=84645 RepID=A0ABQ8MNH1_LABRO|nr:Urea transporter 2 [Labeo rohita]